MQKKKKKKIYLYCQECGEPQEMRFSTRRCCICGGTDFSVDKVRRAIKYKKTDKKAVKKLLGRFS